MPYTASVYADKIKAALSPAERRIFAKLNDPRKIQDYLDSLPINFEVSGETYMSPRRVLRAETAHCFEGAVFAAAALAYHGEKPLLLDLKASSNDVDHVVTLFKRQGRWGAISKTNHATLRYRDPIYKDVRELAVSYFHEYFLPSGKKTLRSYSAPFDLSRYKPESWITTEEDLDRFAEALDTSKHFPVAPEKNLRLLRNAKRFEINVTAATEWSSRRARR